MDTERAVRVGAALHIPFVVVNESSKGDLAQLQLFSADAVLTQLLKVSSDLLRRHDTDGGAFRRRLLLLDVGGERPPGYAAATAAPACAPPSVGGSPRRRAPARRRRRRRVPQAPPAAAAGVALFCRSTALACHETMHTRCQFDRSQRPSTGRKIKIGTAGAWKQHCRWRGRVQRRRGRQRLAPSAGEDRSACSLQRGAPPRRAPHPDTTARGAAHRTPMGHPCRRLMVRNEPPQHTSSTAIILPWCAQSKRVATSQSRESAPWSHAISVGSFATHTIRARGTDTSATSSQSAAWTPSQE